MKNIGRIQKQLISDAMQQMLEDGKIDMVTSARKTPDREEKFDFSRPIGTMAPFCFSSMKAFLKSLAEFSVKLDKAK